MGDEASGFLGDSDCVCFIGCHRAGSGRRFANAWMGRGGSADDRPGGIACNCGSHRDGLACGAGGRLGSCRTGRAGSCGVGHGRGGPDGVGVPHRGCFSVQAIGGIPPRRRGRGSGVVRGDLAVGDVRPEAGTGKHGRTSSAPPQRGTPCRGSRGDRGGDPGMCLARCENERQGPGARGDCDRWNVRRGSRGGGGRDNAAGNGLGGRVRSAGFGLGDARFRRGGGSVADTTASTHAG